MDIISSPELWRFIQAIGAIGLVVGVLALIFWFGARENWLQ